MAWPWPLSLCLYIHGAGPWFRVLGENKDTVAGVTRLHAAGVELPRAIISLRWGLHVLVRALGRDWEALGSQ